MKAKSKLRREALDLSAPKNTELVGEPRLNETDGLIPVPEWLQELIRERLADLAGIPPKERSTPWETVRRRIFVG